MPAGNVHHEGDHTPRFGEPDVIGQLHDRGDCSLLFELRNIMERS